VTLEHPRSVESEVFRVLRTNIQFASIDKPVRTMVVTSAGPREGKSFTAANLAVVLAQAGQRVILVDTDLRRPSQHKLFNLPNTVGFTNLVLKEGGNRMGALQPVPGVPGLWLITSGPLPPNPSEVLNAQQTGQVMEELARAADIVLYDAPPAGAVIDPVILAARVDATVLVINAGVARRDIVLRVKRHLQSVGVRILIPVLNRVKQRDIQGYYYYYYHTDGAIAETPPTNGHHPAEAGPAVRAAVGAASPDDDSPPEDPPE
jgi:capsular exopolysaccharide synthesis family protein